MRRKNKSSKNKQSAIIAGIAIAGFTLGGIATHMINHSGSQETASPENTLTSAKQLTIQEYQAETEKAKQANLLALETEKKWYDELSKNQKKRAEMRQAQQTLLNRIASMEAEKLEFIKLQEMARIEKQAASEAVVHSIQAKSVAEDHALNAYELTLQARQLKEQAASDQEKANSQLNQYAALESDVHETKKSYAILEAKHQVVLNENNRLSVMMTQLQNQQQQQLIKQQREVLVIEREKERELQRELQRERERRARDNDRDNYNPYPHIRPVPCPVVRPTPQITPTKTPRKTHPRHRS